jgi:hypothetical protein
MAIKVTLGATENTQQKKPFPKLMKQVDGDILIYVLTPPNEKGECAVVYLNRYMENPYRKTFLLNGVSRYTDYNEPITIQNL